MPVTMREYMAVLHHTDFGVKGFVFTAPDDGTAIKMALFIVDGWHVARNHVKVFREDAGLHDNPIYGAE